MSNVRRQEKMNYLRLGYVLACLLVAGCATSPLGPQKPPEYRLIRSVSYLSEASDPFEELVKKSVLPTLGKTSEIERAYLVRVEFHGGQRGIALCLTPSSAESMNIAEAIGVVYGPIAEQGVYLDIMFIDEESERAVQEVAKSFYVRP
jgi:hypothetical protein